jgi:hypothetical protein
MALSRRLIELAANGVTDPQELLRLTLEKFSHSLASNAPKRNGPRRLVLRPLNVA